jgi:hypothetical protein
MGRYIVTVVYRCDQEDKPGGHICDAIHRDHAVDQSYGDALVYAMQWPARHPDYPVAEVSVNLQLF